MRERSATTGAVESDRQTARRFGRDPDAACAAGANSPLLSYKPECVETLGWLAVQHDDDARFRRRRVRGRLRLLDHLSQWLKIGTAPPCQPPRLKACLRLRRATSFHHLRWRPATLP